MTRDLITKKHVKLYQKLSGQVIDSLSREGATVDIYIGSGVEIAGIPFDPVNRENLDPNIPLAYDDVVYRVENAVVRWKKPDEYEFTSGGRISPGDVVIECRIEDVLASGTDVNNDTLFHLARKILVDGQIVKVDGYPVKTGLKELFKVKVFCKKVDIE